MTGKLARLLLVVALGVVAVGIASRPAGAAPNALPVPPPLVPCLPVVNCPNPAASLAKDAASAAADATLGAFVKWVRDGAVAILDRIGKLIGAPEPDLNDVWLAKHVKVMQSLGVLVVLPLLLAALVSAIIHQDPGRLVRAVAVYLPLAVLSGFVAVQLTQLALTATDELCAAVSDGMGNDVVGTFRNVAVVLQGAGLPPGQPLVSGFLGFVVALLVVMGAVLIWLELLVRSAAIYIAVLFLPLTLAGLVWPATARWAKKLVEILVALILSKFVVVAVISLAASGLGANPADGLAAGLGGAALFLLAGFAPFVVLRLVPVVEANVIGHMEGTARRPIEAVGATSSQVVSRLVHNAATARGAAGGAATAGTAAAAGTATAAAGAATAGAGIIATKAVGIPGFFDGLADDAVAAVTPASPAHQRRERPDTPPGAAAAAVGSANDGEPTSGRRQR